MISIYFFVKDTELLLLISQTSQLLKRRTRNADSPRSSGLRANTHRLLSSSFLGLPYRILNINHKKELLRGLCLFRFANLRVETVQNELVSDPS